MRFDKAREFCSGDFYRWGGTPPLRALGQAFGKGTWVTLDLIAICIFAGTAVIVRVQSS